MHGWGHMNWGWGGLVVQLLFWIIIILIIFWAIRYFIRLSRTHPPDNPQESSLDILKKRYASGDITKQEFEEMKKDLLE
jgi:putative membrane protein